MSASSHEPTRPPRSGRTRKITLSLVAALLLIGVAGAIVVPRLVDPERYRASIEQAVKEATGWKVRLGKLDVSWWGGISLRARPISMISPSAASQIEVDALEVHAAMLPLLRGRLLVESVTLLRPAIVFGTDEHGSYEWFSPAHKETAAPRSKDAANGGDAAPSGLQLLVNEIAIKGGSIELRDGSVHPQRHLGVRDLSAVINPGSGTVWGSGHFGTGKGKLSWKGEVGQTLALDAEALPYSELRPWIDSSWLSDAGELELHLRGKSLDRFSLEVEAHGLKASSASAPLPRLTLSAQLQRTGDAWNLGAGKLSLGEVRMEGGGALIPVLDQSWRADAVPVEAAIAAAGAFVSVPVEVKGPGTFSALVRLHAGELRGAGKISAARVSVGPGLPALDNVALDFRLEPDRLTVEPLTAGCAGGKLDGRVVVQPLGSAAAMQLTTRLQQADLPKLARQLEAESIAYPGKIAADLALQWKVQQGIVPDAISGTATLTATDVVLPGWEQAGLSETRLDSAGTALDMNSRPWKVGPLEVHGPALQAQGEGTIQTSDLSLKLPLLVRLREDPSRKLAERITALQALQQKDGQLAVAIKLVGPLTSPQLKVDLEKTLAASGRSVQDLAGDLLSSYLNKSKSKKESSKKSNKNPSATAPNEPKPPSP